MLLVFITVIDRGTLLIIVLPFVLVESTNFSSGGETEIRKHNSNDYMIGMVVGSILVAILLN